MKWQKCDFSFNEEEGNLEWGSKAGKEERIIKKSFSIKTFLGQGVIMDAKLLRSRSYEWKIHCKRGTFVYR